jgi:hypothetical protein
MTDTGLQGRRWLAARLGMHAGGRRLAPGGSRARVGVCMGPSTRASLSGDGRAWLGGLSQLGALLGPGDGSPVHHSR